MARGFALELRGVSISFGGLTALDDIDLDVAASEIVALIGPNGAGKTSLFNCISGVYRPTRGSVRFEGRELVGLEPHEIVALGVARTFQNIELFKGMTVLDNLLLGTHARRRVGPLAEALRLPWFAREEHRAVARAQELLAASGSGLRGDEIASELPYGLQKEVEVLRALAMDPRLLLLDEPAAGMTEDEGIALVKLIRRLREARGISVVLVEHNVGLVMSVAERIAVLDHGKRIAFGSADEVRHNTAVIRAYLGNPEGVRA
jgi:branched-chain amino acid transport system ATP-binding protein